jgi:hypothetical protein
MRRLGPLFPANGENQVGTTWSVVERGDPPVAHTATIAAAKLLARIGRDSGIPVEPWAKADVAHNSATAQRDATLVAYRIVMEKLRY